MKMAIQHGKAALFLSAVMLMAQPVWAKSTSVAGPLQPLQEAVRKADMVELSVLIERGTDPNLVDALTRTALHYAAALGNDAAIAMLIGAGASVNVADKDGFTPLMRAAQNGHTAAARRLLEAGAEPSLLNADNQTARDLAEAAGANDIADLLREIRSSP